MSESLEGWGGFFQPAAAPAEPAWLRCDLQGTPTVGPLSATTSCLLTTAILVDNVTPMSGFNKRPSGRWVLHGWLGKPRRSLTVDLVDSGFDRDELEVLYAFRVKFSNPSKIANSIASAKVVIVYRRTESPTMRAEFQAAVWSNVEAVKWPGVRHAAIPFKIKGRSAVEVFLTFSVPRGFFQDLLIDDYVIVLTDSDETDYLLQTINVSEMDIAQG
jgi:hypothetical protein